MRAEWQHLTTIHPSTRPWEMPLAAALSTGLPVLVGAFLGHLGYGLVSSLGGLVFLSLPNTPMYHRMVALMACAFAITACYALGLMSHAMPAAVIPVLTVVTVLVMMVCRYYNLGPPGGIFFVMVASIGAYSPVPFEQVPLMVGLVFMGALLACLIGFFYSLHILRLQEAGAVLPLPRPTFDYVIFDSAVIGGCVGISLLLAVVLQLPRPYWVPVSCLAVIQGASLRAVWNRQLHRVAGTAVGLLVAWGLLLLPLDRWSVAATMIVLTFLIETLVVRHYGVAAVFITPLTILLAEAATLGQTPHAALIQARFLDTALGCVVGLAGGICLHSPRFRTVVGAPLRRLV